MGQSPAPKQFAAPMGIGGNSTPNVLNTASQAAPAPQQQFMGTSAMSGPSGTGLPQQAQPQAPMQPQTQNPLMPQNGIYRPPNMFSGFYGQ